MPECLVCDRPLGSDTIAEGYGVCQDHRFCTSCNGLVSATEIKWLSNNGYKVIKHMRCLIQSDGPSLREAPLRAADVLNMCTLLISDITITERLVESMSFDDAYHFMRGMQAVSANMSILLRKDKRQYEASVQQQELSQRRAERQTKSDAKSTKSRINRDAAAAVGITTTSEKVARVKLTAREKLIGHFMKLGMSRSDAESAVPPSIN